MKKLIIVTGSMGVGKSHLCKELNKRLINSVWLDGDWCMMMNPLNFTAEITKMFLDNSVYLLRNFLSSPTFDYVIYSWVFPREDILDYMVKQVKDTDSEVIKISLICSDDKLKERMKIAGRDSFTIVKSLMYQDATRLMDTIKIDTTELNEDQTVDEALKKILTGTLHNNI